MSPYIIISPHRTKGQYKNIDCKILCCVPYSFQGGYVGLSKAPPNAVAASNIREGKSL